MRVKVVVMCHNTPDTAERLYWELCDVFDVSVLDSGSDEDKRPDVPGIKLCGNLYWTGCWNRAIEMMGDADVLWVLGGDLEMRSSAKEYLRAIQSAMPFGCWSPGVVGRRRDLMSHEKAVGKAWSVWQMEGMGMAMSREAIDAMGLLPEENKLGWGLDVWMAYLCWSAGMRNILDGRVCLHHPESRGYSGSTAAMDMERFFLGTMGPGWRQKMKYLTDEFEWNVREEAKVEERKVSSVTVVVASYNQRRTIEMTLESLSRQTVIPERVVVSDDGSSDDTLGWLDGLPSTRFSFELFYVTRKHDGYNLVGVNNNAAAFVVGSRVMFTNGDILHSPTSVESHALLPANAVGGGLVSGISMPASTMVDMDDVVDFERVRELSRLNPPEMTNADYWAHDPAVNPRCKWGVWGGNYSAPTGMWRRLRFNPEYHLKYGGEEADFIERAIRDGGCVRWARGSISYHLEHPIRTYRKRSLGNEKYRKEYMT